MSDAIKSRRSLVGKKMKSIRAVFKAVDRDGSGSIDRDELREALHRLDIELKDRQLAQLFATIDEDNNGMIDVNELERWLRAAGAEDHPASPPEPDRVEPRAPRLPDPSNLDDACANLDDVLGRVGAALREVNQQYMATAAHAAAAPAAVASPDPVAAAEAKMRALLNSSAAERARDGGRHAEGRVPL